MIHRFGKRAWRPFAVVAALLTMALVLASPGTAGAAATKASKATKAPQPIVAKNDQGMMKSKVVGTGTTASGKVRRVAGTFTPTSFEVVGNQLMANGTLDLIARGHGKPTTGSKQVQVPVQSAGNPGALKSAGSKGMPGAAPAGSCDVLNLVLGPLDLNLLGLEIHLKTVILDIIATPAGGLLGQLLCALVGPNGLLSGLLSGLNLSQLTALVTALNQLLATLGTLGG